MKAKRKISSILNVKTLFLSAVLISLMGIGLLLCFMRGCQPT